MQRILKWKKGIFKNTFELFTDDGVSAGILKESFWGNSAHGEISGKKYDFITKGFWKKRAEISDSSTGSVLATIEFNNWKSKAVIKFSDDPKIILWNIDNFWNTKWSLSELSGLSIRYDGTQTKGEIISDMDNEMLILAGLFMKSYHDKAMAAAAGA